MTYTLVMNNRKYLEAIKVAMLDEINQSPNMGRVMLGSEYGMYAHTLKNNMRSHDKLEQLQFIADRVMQVKGKLHDLISHIDPNVPYEQSAIKAYLDQRNLVIGTPPPSPTATPRGDAEISAKAEPVKINRPKPELKVSPEEREQIAKGVLTAINKYIEFELQKPMQDHLKQTLQGELKSYRNLLSAYNPDGSEDTLNQIKAIAANTKSQHTQVHSFIKDINMRHEIADPRITPRVVDLITTPKSAAKTPEPDATPPRPTTKKG